MLRKKSLSSLLIACNLSNAFSFLSSTSKSTLSIPFLVRHNTHTNTNSASPALNMNFISDIGNMLTGGALGEEKNLPYSPPFCQTNSISDQPQCYAVKERAFSFTGEDFDVFCTENNAPFITVRGAMLHLPGKDKMRLKSVLGCDEEVIVLDRVLMAVSPTYDIYRGGMGAEKIAWMEKEVVAMTDTFDVYLEGSGIGPFKKPPVYKITGDFIDRNFVMRNGAGEVVAKVQKDGLIQFDAFNHYQVQVAPGMDAMLVLACTCAIDEEFDEEHKKKREEE
jgi:uncharacterized protein YxjI